MNRHPNFANVIMKVEQELSATPHRWIETTFVENGDAIIKYGHIHTNNMHEKETASIRVTANDAEVIKNYSL